MRHAFFLLFLILAFPAYSEGLLRIQSQPEGAKVFINGERYGRTASNNSGDFSIVLADGLYDIRLSRRKNGVEQVYHEPELFIGNETELEIFAVLAVAP